MAIGSKMPTVKAIVIAPPTPLLLVVAGGSGLVAGWRRQPESEGEWTQHIILLP
jgi:hypothetical protein